MALQIGMGFLRDSPSQVSALLTSLCARAQKHGTYLRLQWHPNCLPVQTASQRWSLSWKCRCLHWRAPQVRERAVTGDVLGDLRTDTYADPAMTATNSN